MTSGSDIYKNLTPVQRVVKGDGTAVNDSNDNINSDYYSGIFLAINKGTIKNLTFEFSNKYALSSEIWQVHFDLHKCRQQTTWHLGQRQEDC